MRPTTVADDTRLTASPAFESGEREICSLLIESCTVFAILRCSSSPRSLWVSTLPMTTTSSANEPSTGLSARSRCRKPSTTFTPLTSTPSYRSHQKRTS